MYVCTFVKTTILKGHEVKRKQDWGTTWERLEREKGKNNVIIFKFLKRT